MKRFLLSFLLCTTVWANYDSSYEESVGELTIPSSGVTSRVFFQYGLGHESNHVKYTRPYIFASTDPKLYQATLSPHTISPRGLLNSFHGGGDYLFPGTSFSLGGIFGYSLVRAKSNIPIFMTNFYLKQRGHLDLALRSGVKWAKWLFFVQGGMAWHFFSAKFESAASDGSLRFKSRGNPFLLLGLGLERTITPSLVLGGVYHFHTGKINLSRYRLIANQSIFQTLPQGGLNFKTNRSNISEFLLTLKYVFPRQH